MLDSFRAGAHIQDGGLVGLVFNVHRRKEVQLVPDDWPAHRKPVLGGAEIADGLVGVVQFGREPDLGAQDVVRAVIAQVVECRTGPAIGSRLGDGVYRAARLPAFQHAVVVGAHLIFADGFHGYGRACQQAAEGHAPDAGPVKRDGRGTGPRRADGNAVRGGNGVHRGSQRVQIGEAAARGGHIAHFNGAEPGGHTQRRHPVYGLLTVADHHFLQFGRLFHQREIHAHR